MTSDKLAERPIRRWTKGVAEIEWLVDSVVRNEPQDRRLYATAAPHGLYAQGFRFAAPNDPPPPAPKMVKSAWMER